MLTLLLGTDWTQNRKVLLDMIADDVANQRPGRILMVPELISHDTERRLAHAAGDTASRFAEVLSFPRFARRVCESCGQGLDPCLDNGGRVVAMAAAVRNVHSQLKAYASVETRPEFLSGLVDAVDEFKRCCITAEDLRTASKNTEGSLAQKLEELSLLLEAYDGLCQNGKRDPRDQMTWLLEQLEDCSYAEDHVFYIDGFPDFTRQHMAIVAHLIERSEQVVVSVNCDVPNSTDIAFEKAGATAAELIHCAHKAGVETQIRVVDGRCDPLAYMRKHLFAGRITAQPALSKKLQLYRVGSVYDECQAVAEQILELVQNGARYRQINVVCADMPAYRNIIETVFDRCKIPAYISGTEDILDKTVITTVLAAIDAALGGFEQKDVLRYCRSLLSPIDIDACDRLENYVIIWNITGNRWLDTWTAHPNGLDSQWTEKSRERLQKLNWSRELVIGPIQRLHEGFTKAQTLRQQVESLAIFFQDIRLENRLSELANRMDAEGDNRNAQMLDQLWEILLAALEQMYDVIGNSVWDAQTFVRMLRLLLSQYDVGTIPTVLDAVTIGPISAMRCQQQKHLIVLGALEGNLPGYGGSTGILSDQERNALRALGVPLTGGSIEGLQAEFGEIYSVFCGAEESVRVFCPTGQPSFLYRRLLTMAGNETQLQEQLGAVLADPDEAAAYLVRWDAEAYAKRLGIDDDYRRIDRRRKHALGLVSRENVQKLYGTKLKLSASQVDRQADCRMSYFLKYGLRAKERKTITVDPAEFGTYVHAVLEQTAKRVMELGGFQAVSAEQTMQIAAEYSQEYAQARFSQIESVRNDYLFQRNFRELAMIVQELWQELSKSQFKPVGFEVGFDDDQQLPAIEIPASAMDAQLRGFVDRIDTWREGDTDYFRVVDYKTGKKDFDYCDVFNGLGLQMLLYMFAIENVALQNDGAKLCPAGVQYFPARAPLVLADGQLSDEESEAAREKLWLRRGLLLNYEAALLAMDPDNDPQRLCVRKKKDGSFTGDMADTEQLRLLKKYIFRLLGKMVDDIASGNVDANPYTRGNSHNACAFCPYGSICHSAEVENRRNYKAMNAQRFWEEIKKELDENG